MLGVPFGVLGGLGWRLWSHWGLMKTLKNHWFLLCFQHLGVLGGLLRTLFLFFFDFRSYFDRFFGFRLIFLFSQLYLRSFFGFRSFWSVSSGAIRLHERIHGRD